MPDGTKVKSSGDILYVPEVAGSDPADRDDIIALRAFNASDGSRAADSDITLTSAIFNAEIDRSSLVYHIDTDSFFFLDKSGIVNIRRDGQRFRDSSLGAYIAANDINTLVNIDDYIVLHNDDHDGGEKTHLVCVSRENQTLAPIVGNNTIVLGDPISGVSGYQHGKIVKIGRRFYTITAQPRGLSVGYRIYEYYAGNGIFDVHKDDLDPVIENQKSLQSQVISNANSIFQNVQDILKLKAEDPTSSNADYARALGAMTRGLAWALPEGRGAPRGQNGGLSLSNFLNNRDDRNKKNIITGFPSGDQTGSITGGHTGNLSATGADAFCALLLPGDSTTTKIDFTINSAFDGLTLGKRRDGTEINTATVEKGGWIYIYLHNPLPETRPTDYVMYVVNQDNVADLPPEIFEQVMRLVSIFAYYFISANIVTTEDIQDGAVTAPKLADNAVTTPKLHNKNVTLEKLEDGYEWTVNGQEIEKESIGVTEFASVFTTDTSLIGGERQKWVPANMTDALKIVQSPIEISGKKEINYGLELADEVVNYKKTRNPLDLENLIGLAFIKIPPGATTQSRAGIDFQLNDNQNQWITESTTATDHFRKLSNQSRVELPIKRIPETRELTHILVRAGFKSDLANTDTRSELIDATINSDDLVYQEIMVPLSSPIPFTRLPNIRNFRSDVYRILLTPTFAAAIVVDQMTDGKVTVSLASVDGSNLVPNGLFVSFHIVRGMGG